LGRGARAKQWYQLAISGKETSPGLKSKSTSARRNVISSGNISKGDLSLVRERGVYRKISALLFHLENRREGVWEIVEKREGFGTYKVTIIRIRERKSRCTVEHSLGRGVVGGR